VKVRTTRGYLAQYGVGPDELDAAYVYEAPEGGCDECHGTGYRSRIGVFEIMAMDDELERLFLAQAPAETLRKAALAAGMRTLRRDALDKVAAGITSLAEISRVII
jgi:type IV pilus assembly protein PilB